MDVVITGKGLEIDSDSKRLHPASNRFCAAPVLDQSRAHSCGCHKQKRTFGRDLKNYAVFVSNFLEMRL